ncbi:MAG: 30S ribosomal protein S18 [bacterium]|nr:30S ribosomal protein S18 [bacterium]
MWTTSHSKQMKTDYLKENKVDYMDYKDVDTLKKFLTPHARIQGRKRTNISSKHQRMLSVAIKRARFMGLLPYVSR